MPDDDELKPILNCGITDDLLLVALVVKLLLVFVLLLFGKNDELDDESIVQIDY